MKYRVKKNRTITYPDGGLRGERGYVVDGAMWYERGTLEDYADALELVERQTPVSPAEIERILGKAPAEVPVEAPAEPPEAAADEPAPEAVPEPGVAETPDEGVEEEA